MGLQRFAAAGREGTGSDCHLINAAAAVDLFVGPVSDHITASGSQKIFKSHKCEPHNVKTLLLELLN